MQTASIDEFKKRLDETSLDDCEAVVQLLSDIDEEALAIQEPIRQKLSILLEQLGEAKTHFASYEDNRRFVSVLRRVLNHLHRRIACPKCGEPSYIACFRPPPASKLHEFGAFQCQHSQASSSGHGAWEFIPSAQLVDPPTDRRKRR